MGIYTRHESPMPEDVNTVDIYINGSKQPGAATLATGGTDYGHFYYYLSGLAEGHTYEIKAKAAAGDNRGGFDVINATAVIDRTPPIINITSPADGAYINSDLILIAGAINETVSGIQ